MGVLANVPIAVLIDMSDQELDRLQGLLLKLVDLVVHLRQATERDDRGGHLTGSNRNTEDLDQNSGI